MVIAVKAALDYKEYGRPIAVVVIGWLVNLVIIAVYAATFGSFT